MGDFQAANLSLLQSLAAAVQAMAASVSQLQAKLAPAPAFSPPLADVVNEFLLAKAQAGRSPRYVRQAAVSLGAFTRGRESRPVATIAAGEIAAWLGAQGWAPATQRSYLTDLRTLFAWALRRGYLGASPAAAVDTPSLTPDPPAIHSPAQVAAVLAIAGRLDHAVRRALAVRYFAGLRASEAGALAESEIGPEWIEVKAAKAKTRRRRLVPVLPCLAAWLAQPGELPLTDANTRWGALGAQVRAAGIPWGKNYPRHSFVSYFLAREQNAGRVALVAGHTEAVLFSNYRELVTPEAAADYFAIFPAGSRKKTRQD